EQRVREGYIGINELDCMCKLHDKYYNENQNTQSRNISDIALAHRANEIANDPRYDNEQRNAAKLVALIMNQKVRFGLGINTQSRNISNIALAHRANEIANEIANDPRYDNEQRNAAKLVALIINNEVKFGLGIKTSKNLKKGSDEKEVVGPFEELAEELHKPV